MPPCLKLSIRRYGSKVKWVNSGKGVVPSPIPWCCSYWKGNFRVTLYFGHQLYFYLYICIWFKSLFSYILTNQVLQWLAYVETCENMNLNFEQKWKKPKKKQMLTIFWGSKFWLFCGHCQEQDDCCCLELTLRSWIISENFSFRMWRFNLCLK